MKLLLSGGGDACQVKELDSFFAKEIKGGKVLYIPVAMDKIPYDDCFSWFKDTYMEYGIDNIDMCINLNECNNLNDYSAIFIGGGNTFKLLKEIKESNFDKKIIEYLNNDGFVYGGSAGAIIFGKNIETAIHADKNKVDLKDLNSLDLLNGYNVWCHYDEEKDKEELKKIEGNIFVLFEESGLFYNGKTFTKIGKEYIEIQ